MLLTSYLNQAIEKLDFAASRIQVSIHERSGSLITLFVHNLFLDAAEIERDLAYPQQCLTVGQLEQAIKYFQSVGYRFVSPTEIIAGLNPDERHVLLTFDDGYFNNQRALPLMELYKVPALFFVPARMIQHGKAYWWDELYRTRRREGRSQDEACAEIGRQTGRRTDEVENQFSKELGVSGFCAVSDVDRLFTPEELREFASHPLVFIGNHTCFHEFLTAYPAQEASRAIIDAQESIYTMTGKASLAIAYPCGAYSDQILDLVRDAGLPLGFGTVARKEYLENIFQGDRALSLGRHTLWGIGKRSIEAQCDFMRSDVGLHYRYRLFMEKLKRKKRRAQDQ